jgi:hypothetical protein
MSLLDGPHPKNKTKRGDLGKKVTFLLSLKENSIQSHASEKKEFFFCVTPNIVRLSTFEERDAFAALFK